MVAATCVLRRWAQRPVAGAGRALPPRWPQRPALRRCVDHQRWPQCLAERRCAGAMAWGRAQRVLLARALSTLPSPGPDGTAIQGLDGGPRPRCPHVAPPRCGPRGTCAILNYYLVRVKIDEAVSSNYPVLLITKC